MKPTLRLALTLVALLAGAPRGGAQDYPRYRPVGSASVPLDSWVYPVLERLAALGYVRTALWGMKPWARTECARLTEEAGENFRQAILEDRPTGEAAARLLALLEREFAFELEALNGGRTVAIRLESVYARAVSLAGEALADGFHFGQTLAYELGRPLRRGTNAFGGVAARAMAGPWAVYFRGEYQHAPSAPAASSVADLIAQLDRVPPRPAVPASVLDRGQILEVYVLLNLKNWQLSFGKQSLDWGIGAGGSLLLSRNAEPLVMARIARAVPFRLPGWLGRLGPLRTEFFFTRLSGHVFRPRPYLYGQKIAFRVHPRFEVGYGRTTMLGGGGARVGLGGFVRSFFGISDSSGGIPGDTRTTLDLVFHMPGVRELVVLYAELYQDDERIFFKNPGRGAIRPGIWITRLPGLAQMDLRAEYVSTESPGHRDHHGDFNYWNSEYRDGYTHKGQLLGNTVGRQGRALQVWSNYWFSPRHGLELRFRHNRINPDFVPGGGNWRDYAVGHRFYHASGLYVRSSLQLEHIRSYPALFAGSRSNVAASLELGFVPE